MWATVRDQNVIVGFGVTYYYDYIDTAHMIRMREKGFKGLITRIASISGCVSTACERGATRCNLLTHTYDQ